jgi:lipopolysaccharide/colanic/teichoic acid biosynthesis glycosyltransferase
MDPVITTQAVSPMLPPMPVPAGKRALDVLLAGTGLVLSSPLWALLAIAIKLEDGGAVFFSQGRAGEGGRVFRAWKFRSMIPDAEKHVGAVQATGDLPQDASGDHAGHGVDDFRSLEHLHGD